MEVGNEMEVCAMKLKLMVVLVGLAFALGAAPATILDGVTRLHYYEGGAPFDCVEELSIGFADQRITLDCYEDRDDYRNKTNAYLRLNHVCTEKEWRFVRQKLTEAELSTWKTRYCNPNVRDGTFWKLELYAGEKAAHAYSGANDWPKQFRAFFAIKQFALKHKDAKSFTKTK